MADESWSVGRKIGLERSYHGCQHSADALTWRQILACGIAKRKPKLRILKAEYRCSAMSLQIAIIRGLPVEKHYFTFNLDKTGRTFPRLQTMKMTIRLFLVVGAFAGVGGLAPAKAVSPPDGCYPAFTTAEGFHASFRPRRGSR